MLTATESDAAILLGQTLDREETLRRISGDHGPDAVVMTCRGDGRLAFDGDGIVTFPAFLLALVNGLGAGDAFNAGLLYRLITADLRTGLAGPSLRRIPDSDPEMHQPIDDTSIPLVRRDLWTLPRQISICLIRRAQRVWCAASRQQKQLSLPPLHIQWQ